jgi:hypothetical protein
MISVGCCQQSLVLLLFKVGVYKQVGMLMQTQVR